MLDLHDRRIKGWAMAGHMRTELAEEALEMAVRRHRPPPGLLHHSDRGSQYTSHVYRQRLRTHGMICSMSRKGNCWDNAVMERFFGTLKSEWTAGQRYRTRHEARLDVMAFIEMEHNSQRLHSTLDYCSPSEHALAHAA